MGSMLSSSSGPIDKEAVKSLVDSTISSNKIVVFSKSWCPYCARAKKLLASQFPDVPAKVLELDEMNEGDAVQAYLGERTRQGTVPNIFINQKHVGGCDDLVSLDRQGKLAGLIRA